MNHALIVGAGIGGLAAAVALQRAGWSVRVFERSAQARELGFALNLASNAMAALRELGVADAVVREGYQPRIAEIRGERGRVIRQISATSIASDSVVAMRPVVHGALWAAAGADNIELSREVSGFDASIHDVRLHCSDGHSESGTILIGADGVASAIRRQLHPTEPTIYPSGYCAVRGVVHDVDSILGPLHAIAYLASGLEAAVVRASAHGAYWYLSLLADDVQDKSLPPRAIAEQRTRQLDATFRGVLAATHEDDLRFDVLFQRPHLPRWGAGRVTLLGDAAHPMLPHTGQGAAQAMEDAVALGLALKRDSDVEHGLRRYEAVRSVRTSQFVKAGPRIAAVTTSRSRVVSTMRNAVARLAPDALLMKALQNRNQKDPHASLR